MSKKVDFRNIVIRDINGQETKADVTALFGNMLVIGSRGDQTIFFIRLS